MKRLIPAVIVSLFLLGRTQTTLISNFVNSREIEIQKNPDSLKRIASTGDLIVLLRNDLLSYQIKFLNEADQSYSHAGIIIEKENEKFIAHIAPDETGKDGIQYTPIDSFLSPQKNLFCALYCYNFTQAEGESIEATLEKYRADKFALTGCMI